jgi:hypothetical protein
VTVLLFDDRIQMMQGLFVPNKRANHFVKKDCVFFVFNGKIENADQDPRFEEMGKKVLQGILGDQSFSLKEAGLAKIEEMACVLKAAIE